jgi:hypothetical protein
VFKLATNAFPDGAVIPAVYTCEGDNISPALEWVGEPSGTESFALIVDDPDAPAGTWNHWLLWDIPKGTHSLAEGYQPASWIHSGKNDFGELGYGGPCPPRHGGMHRYFFRLYAIDTPMLGVRRGAHRKELDRALSRHRIGVAEYMGRFERK